MNSSKILQVREIVFHQVELFVTGAGLNVVSKDLSRPWGGFLVIDESHAAAFAHNFFPELPLEFSSKSQKLSPKILIVAPNKKLSWQYHHRRAEIWKLIGGSAGLITSDTNAEGQIREMKLNELVTLRQGERHRLIGLLNWGVVAEIWRHMDSENPSDENDIVHL